MNGRMADGRVGERMIGAFGLVVLLLSGSPPVHLSAQDSQFGIRGLGTPGRFETVRARSTAGAFGPFDAMSPIIEASLADLPRLTASAMGGTSYRDADVAGVTTALRTTRFPGMGLAGPVLSRVTIAGGFTTYLDRSWAVTIRDSVVLRGAMEPYTDEITSAGGVTDLRLAAAARISSRFALGVGVHLLSGSTRVAASRRFDDDTTYQAIRQIDDVRFDGAGVSASAVLDIGRGLRIAAFGRTDNRLRARVRDAETARTNLPRTVGGAVRLAPSPSARVAASVAWRAWADAGPGSFNTLSWSAGAELGSSFSPIRVGVRGGRLPFGPGGSAPTELGFAVGTGKAFSESRAVLDLGIEHLQRKSEGITERVWTFLVGLTVRP
jgi:hypothetical protein